MDASCAIGCAATRGRCFEDDRKIVDLGRQKQMENKLACASGGYAGLDLDRVLSGISNAGFRYVELSATPSAKARISPEQMSDEDVKQFQAKLAGYGLTPVSI